MVKAKVSNVCCGVPIGVQGSHLTDLHFMDDILLICKPDIEELINMKRGRRCFQIMFGLKINFQKSCQFGVGVNNDDLNH